MDYKCFFQAYHADHQTQHAELYSFFTHLFSWTDISDHKGGVLLLCANLAACAGVRWHGRRAAVAVGGAKRLHALSTAAGVAVLVPWALYHWKELVSTNQTKTRQEHRILFEKNILPSHLTPSGISKELVDERKRSLATSFLAWLVVNASPLCPSVFTLHAIFCSTTF